MSPEVVALREEFRRAPRFNAQSYIPGFGGHARRWACKCTIADELINGRTHPDKREPPAAIELRKRGALVVAEREARISSWLADLCGSGAEREKPKPKYQRPARLMLEQIESERADRRLSNEESRAALTWMRKQVLPKVLEGSRQEIAAQAWLELRCPPVGASASVSFDDDVRRAWWRAIHAIRAERKASWPKPRSSEFDASGKKKLSF